MPSMFAESTATVLTNQIVSQAIVVAVGVAADGRREVLVFEVGESENTAFWTSLLRSLEACGLLGVRPVMSDAHTGLKKTIETVLQGDGWQRCRVPFMRNVRAMVAKRSQAMGIASSLLAELTLTGRKPANAATFPPPQCWSWPP